MRYLPIIAVIALNLSALAKAEMPIYAAYVSESVAAQCEQSAPSQCQLNAFDGDTLTQLVASLPDSVLIAQALGVSEYEVLIGNAVVNINDATQRAELVLEITTTWRQLPIDDFNIRRTTTLANTKETARSVLAEWAAHLENNLILEADKIYQVLGASDYEKELKVPESIGDFVRMQSAVFRDPLLGSVTRYSHPRFDSAIVDIAVYPFSPFLKKVEDPTRPLHAVDSNETSVLHLEMENEVSQIKQLIAQAKIDDYTISSITSAPMTIAGLVVEGLRLEVMLHGQTDPVYSTQYIFRQNDKIIKVTGNLPEVMMSQLVLESLPQIKVPGESSFMRALRQG